VIQHGSVFGWIDTGAEAILVTICLTAMAYYAFAIYSARTFFRRAPKRLDGPFPPVTVLKPLRGLDHEAYRNFASFCRQDYPEFQIVFGADDADEPALEVARAIARDFPHVDVSIVVSQQTPAANPKIGNLAGMFSAAKHSVLLISDSDIRVGPLHLRTMVQPLSDRRVGVVTCLYRSHAHGFAGQLDALSLSTEFQPSVLVARQLEGITFAMGSGICIRRSVLEEIGGFAAIADYLADDYFLGNLPTRAGHVVELANHVVEHRLDTESLTGLIHHQSRWNRGTRAARPWGYAGLLFTHGVPAALLLPLAAEGAPAAWALSVMTLAARLTMAWYVAVRGLRDPVARRTLWLVPLRDLLGFALWIGAYLGTTIVWRGQRFRLGEGGKLSPSHPMAPASTGEAIATTRAVS
jgi:ceramide glucosyltransferase